MYRCICQSSRWDRWSAKIQRLRATKAMEQQKETRQFQVLDPSWIVAARIAILGFALLSGSISTFVLESKSSQQLAFMYLPVAILFLFSGFSAYWLKTRPTSRGFLYLQLAVDMLVVTGAIYITGGAVSPFLFLYLPLVMAAAIFSGRNTALAVAFINGIIYSSLAWCMVNGIIPPADGTGVVHVPTSGLLLQCIGLSSAMVLVAIATSYLTRSLTLSYLLAAQSQQKLHALSRQQQSLVDGMEHGMIITNLQGSIASINQAAKELLEVRQQDFQAKPLTSLTKYLGDSERFSGDLDLHKDSRGEFSINNAEGKEITRIAFYSQAILNEAGQASGNLIVLQDVTRLRSAEEQLAMQERMARLLAESSITTKSSPTQLANFVGESLVMKKVFSLIERVAPSDATVLISGESGTGKELVAKAIHLGSKRSSGKFVPVNCGAIPETLIESELFGHKKGSFTGADSDHIGLFREANGGTIFLDEIGELPLQTQAKLLRALQERSVRPVGSETSIPINVRVIAATNRDLKSEVSKERFREDLYYRLNVISIQLPPLAARKEDIPLLASSLLRRICQSDQLPTITPAAMKHLMDYQYPGNVRELQNILERAVVFGGEVILPEHLPDLLQQATESTQTQSGALKETLIIEDQELDFPIKLDEILERVEKHYLEVALLQTGGAKKKAAELLGMNFRSFRYRLQKFGISDGE